MKCPNCGYRMKYEYETAPIVVEYHYCPMCKISYNVSSKTWSIPERYDRITDKQQSAVNFINNALHLNFKPVLKSEATNIIKKYLNTAEEVAYEEFDDLIYSFDFYNEFLNG